MECVYIDSFSLKGLQFNGAWMYSNDNTSFLLSPNGTSIMLDASLVAEILTKKITDELGFKLVSHGFASVPSSPSLVNTTSNKPTFFIIDLTQRCNLNCTYCFRDFQQRNSSISINELENICNYISNYCRKYNIKNFYIQPWGGEPLLEFNKILHIQDYFARRNQYPHISIETNATLISEDIAKELYKRHISVGISIDGDQVIHDKQRPYNSQKGSFNDVVRGLINLQKVGFTSFGTISVVTNNSIDNIESIIKYMVKVLKLTNLKFNLVRTSENSNLAVSVNKIDIYVEKLFSTIISLLKDGYIVSEGNIIERIYNLLTRQERNICKSRGCMGGRKMVSFNKKGEIFPCEMIDYADEKIGSILDEDLIDVVNNAIETAKYFKTKTSNQCRQCPWWYYCKGGCHAAIKYRNNSYEGIDEIECQINQKLYPMIIDLILNQPILIEKITKGKIKIY